MHSACVTPFAAILSSTAGMSATSSGKLMWQCESTNIRWIRGQRSEKLPRGSAARVTALIPDRWSLQLHRMGGAIRGDGFAKHLFDLRPRSGTGLVVGELHAD